MIYILSIIYDELRACKIVVTAQETYLAYVDKELISLGVLYG